MSRNRTLLYISLVLTLVLYLLHLAAGTFFLYWTYWWFDWLMHFLAGLAGGFAAFWFLFGFGVFRNHEEKLWVPVMSVLLCLLVVGVAWEIFEYVYGIMDAHEERYIMDVANDLVADSAGAILAALFGIRWTFARYNPIAIR